MHVEILAAVTSVSTETFAASAGGVIAGFVTGTFIYPLVDRARSLAHTSKAYRLVFATVFGHAALGGAGGAAGKYLFQVPAASIWGPYLIGALIGCSVGAITFLMRERTKVKNKQIEEIRQQQDKQSERQAQLTKTLVKELPKLLDELKSLPNGEREQILKMLRAPLGRDEEDRLDDALDDLEPPP